MNASKFEDIIKHNIDNKEEVMACVDKFYGLLGMDSGSQIMDLPQVIGSLFSSNNFFAIQLPMKDQELGALCFKGNYGVGYIFINSSLPQYNVNFALCHEVCHVCINKDIDYNTAELYENASYLGNRSERIANQFAGIVLMPERHIRRMYEKFASEVNQKDEISPKAVVICKLMSYFKSPYMAVLIRLRELNLINDSDALLNLLPITHEDVQRIYEKYWLDTTALRPTFRDDYPRLKDLVKTVGAENLEAEVMYEADLNEGLKNLDELYHQIKEG